MKRALEIICPPHPPPPTPHSAPLRDIGLGPVPKQLTQQMSDDFRKGKGRRSRPSTFSAEPPLGSRPVASFHQSQVQSLTTRMTTRASIFTVPSTVGQLSLQAKQTSSCQHHICPRRAGSCWPLGPELTWPRASHLCSHTPPLHLPPRAALRGPGTRGRGEGSACTDLASGTNRVGGADRWRCRGPAVTEPKQFAMILQFRSRAGHVFKNSEDSLCRMTCRIT